MQENQRFLEIIERLNKEGVSFAAIARAIGEQKQKIINIRHGNSTADETLLRKLFIAYPKIQQDYPDDVKLVGLESKLPYADIEEQLNKVTKERDEWKALYLKLSQQLQEQTRMTADITNKYIALLEQISKSD